MTPSFSNPSRLILGAFTAVLLAPVALADSSAPPHEFFQPKTVRILGISALSASNSEGTSAKTLGPGITSTSIVRGEGHALEVDTRLRVGFGKASQADGSSGAAVSGQLQQSLDIGWTPSSATCAPTLGAGAGIDLDLAGGIFEKAKAALGRTGAYARVNIGVGCFSGKHGIILMPSGGVMGDSRYASALATIGARARYLFSDQFSVLAELIHGRAGISAPSDGKILSASLSAQYKPVKNFGLGADFRYISAKGVKEVAPGSTESPDAPTSKSVMLTAGVAF